MVDQNKMNDQPKAQFAKWNHSAVAVHFAALTELMYHEPHLTLFLCYQFIMGTPHESIGVC